MADPANPPKQRKIAPYRFSAESGRWIEEKEVIGVTPVSSPCSLVTYNVWFDTTAWFDDRCAQLVRLIEASDADFVCLQEVLPVFLRYVQRSDIVRSRYSMSDVADAKGERTASNTLGSYGVVILAKPTASALAMVQLPTRMGRSLLYGVYPTADGSTLAIGTVHLESLDSPRARREQFGICTALLDTLAPHSSLCGDFNFCSYRNFRKSVLPKENDMLAELAPDYVDTWAALRPDEKGYTFDSEANNVISHPEQMRYDRIMLRSAEWAATDIRMIGNTAFQAAGRPGGIFASDHFGLHAVFTRLAA
eukprot:c16322_g1_i2.p1 GENE.c16322_g1_i2~~c16322_g1_i2.p1  ORF type:complete len:321 (-),score=48.45 c16322_g1_i2:121-1041(-)